MSPHFIPLAPDAEQYTGMTRLELRQLCREKILEHYRKPGTHARYMILKSSLDRFMAARGHLPSLVEKEAAQA